MKRNGGNRKYIDYVTLSFYSVSSSVTAYYLTKFEKIKHVD